MQVLLHTCPSSRICQSVNVSHLENCCLKALNTVSSAWLHKLISHCCYCCEGEVISTEGLQRRQQQAKRAAHVYSMQLAPGLIIDARRKGNIARLINHSCSPNCETQKWTDAATGQSNLASQPAQSSCYYVMVYTPTMKHPAWLGSCLFCSSVLVQSYNHMTHSWSSRRLHGCKMLTARRLHCLARYQYTANQSCKTKFQCCIHTTMDSTGWWGAGATRIGIFARQDIATDEELTYDYCFEHTGLATTDVSMYRYNACYELWRSTFSNFCLRFAYVRT